MLWYREIQTPYLPYSLYNFGVNSSTTCRKLYCCISSSAPTLGCWEPFTCHFSIERKQETKYGWSKNCSCVFHCLGIQQQMPLNQLLLNQSVKAEWHIAPRGEKLTRQIWQMETFACSLWSHHLGSMMMIIMMHVCVVQAVLSPMNLLQIHLHCVYPCRLCYYFTLELEVR